MFPTDQQMSFQNTPMEVQEQPTRMLMETNGTASSQVPKYENTQNGEVSQVEFALFHSKRLQSELEVLGNKIKQHDANTQFLTSHKAKLDESILDLQVQMSKLPSSSTPKRENDDTNLQGQDIDAQIRRHGNSAAGILGLVHVLHSEQASLLMTAKGIIGVVAKLGKVNDENLSKGLSNYLGIRSMLAIVCKNSDSVNALESYDNRGNIDKNAGLHGLGATVGKTIESQFDVICLDNLSPYIGKLVADDPQRALDLQKPKLSTGELPPGFIGFAVNMIQIDPAYLHCTTSTGYGLRETLFYNLFKRLQVYKTRVDMINALPCISDGAISLDGGIIRASGIFTVGNHDEVNVRFAKPIASRTTDNYGEMEKTMKELKWKKEKALEDIKREQVHRDQTMYNFGKKKDEFLKFVKRH